MVSLEVPQCCQLFGVSSLSSDCRRLFAIIVSVVCPYRSVRKLPVTHSQFALDLWRFGVVCLALCVFDVGVGRLALGIVCFTLGFLRLVVCRWSFGVGLW